MSFSLYTATIPAYQQILGAVSGLLDKADAFCKANSLAQPELIQARLAPDMLPFAYQVKETVVHSVGSIEGVRRGSFSPDKAPPPESFAKLKATVAEALTTLAGIQPLEVNGFIGREMRFISDVRSIDFTAENFLLSFSQPNFYFHATTAYDILRWKGVVLGKRDFLGRLRLKT